MSPERFVAYVTIDKYYNEGIRGGDRKAKIIEKISYANQTGIDAKDCMPINGNDVLLLMEKNNTSVRMCIAPMLEYLEDSCELEKLGKLQEYGIYVAFILFMAVMFIGMALGGGSLG